jgi:fatty-acyl-CoA synthase
VFIRVQSELEVTSTFKQKKVDLVREGFNPAAIRDPIYFNDPAAKAFVRLDDKFYQRIESGEIRL